MSIFKKKAKNQFFRKSLKNPNNIFDTTKLSKNQDIYLGGMISYYIRMPEKKQKVGTSFQFETSVNNANKLNFAILFDWRKLKKFDFFLKFKVSGVNSNILDNKIIDEIKDKVNIFFLFKNNFIISISKERL